MTTPSAAPRILFFSPYASWPYHTALEVTWAHALKLRGADVHFVACDAMSKTCDVYREGINPRNELSCMECQASTANQLLGYALPYSWLGRYLPPGAEKRATEWVESIPHEQLLSSVWNELPVGQWAATSAYAQFRSAELATQDPRIERVVRDLLLGTVLFAEALDALLEDYQPDTMITLNGRFFGHWTAIELAKKRGIRFVSHERGYRDDTVRFAENGRTHDLHVKRAMWERWRDVALNHIELKSITDMLEERRHANNASRIAFSPAMQDHGVVRQKLGLDERPIVAVFNSSDDETAAFPERRAGAFPQSRDFLPAILEVARARPDLQFILRMHPNIEKERAGTNKDALQHAHDMRDQAPENTRVILPRDDVSSYSIMDIASLGIVYGSTIGLEIGALGKPVLCAAQTTYSHVGFAHQVDSPDQLAPMIQLALDQAQSGEDGREIMRKALRWAFRYFREFAIPFDLVHEEPNDKASLAFSNLGPLQEGMHPMLDRICRFLLGESGTVLPDVSQEERDRTTAEEDAFLDRWLPMAQQRGHNSQQSVA